MNKAGLFLFCFLVSSVFSSGNVALCAGNESSAEIAAVEKNVNKTVNASGPVKDDIVENILKQRNIQKPYIHTVYNYKSTKKTPLRISLKERIKSEADLYEGQIVEFQAESAVYNKKDLKIKKGDTIKARVATIITSGMNGIPASIIFEFIEVSNVKRGQMTDTLEVFGQDRSLIVFPLKWALTILPPTGSLTNFIMGGHVKIKEGKIFTIYYHPEWL